MFFFEANTVFDAEILFLGNHCIKLFRNPLPFRLVSRSSTSYWIVSWEHRWYALMNRFCTSRSLNWIEMKLANGIHWPVQVSLWLIVLTYLQKIVHIWEHKHEKRLSEKLFARIEKQKALHRRWIRIINESTIKNITKASEMWTYK